VGVFKCLSVTGLLKMKRLAHNDSGMLFRKMDRISLLNTLFLLGVLSGAGNDQLSISQIKINDQDDEFMILILIFFFFLHVI
jgi:hypothetical protein